MGGPLGPPLPANAVKDRSFHGVDAKSGVVKLSLFKDELDFRIVPWATRQIENFVVRHTSTYGSIRTPSFGAGFSFSRSWKALLRSDRCSQKSTSSNGGRASDDAYSSWMAIINGRSRASVEKLACSNP